MRAHRLGMLFAIAWAGCGAFGDATSGSGGDDAGAGLDGSAGSVPDGSAIADASATDAGLEEDAAKARQSLYRDAIIADTPLAYYRLGDAAGSRTADTSVGNNDGDIVGSPGPAFGGAGLFPASGSLTFDGQAGSYAKVESLGLNAAFCTFEVWIFFADPVSTSARNIAYRAFSDAAFGVYVSASSGFGVSRIGLGTKSFVQTGVAPTPNVWHHVVVRIVASNPPDLFVDGVATGTTGAGAESPDPSGPFYLGTKASNEAPLQAGTRVTEVAVYNYSLSAARIAEHYALGKP